MSAFLKSCLQKYSSFLARKRSNISSTILHSSALPTRQKSTLNSQKTRLRYGAVMTKPEQENSIKPLVVILGWNDCKLRHLEKYSNIFQSKGWSTICVPAKSFNTFFRSGTALKKIGLYIVEVIKDQTQNDQTQNDQPVLLYAFSNGGCGIYFHLAEALTNIDSPHLNSVNVIGSIFDSCPVNPTIESVRRVQLSITENVRSPILRAMIWYPVGLLLPLLVKINPLLQRFFHDLAKIPLGCPQLFLYSKADHLALPEDIEEHIADQRVLGIQVFSKCWDNSSHVQHYIKFPEEYVKLLEDFVTTCYKEQI